MADYAAKIDVQQYDAIGTRQSVVHVADQIYAIACRGADSDGYVYTVTIDTDGTITALDSLEFADANTIGGTKIIHLAGDNYAILYNSYYKDARIATISITSEGVIALIDDQPVDSIQFGSSSWPCFDFIKVSGTTYAMIYSGADSDGFLTTLSIADNGTVGAVIQTWEFDTEFSVLYPTILHISGDIYVISGPDALHTAVALHTVNIAADGTITTSFVDSLTLDNNSHLRIIPLAGTKYAAVYKKSSDTSCQ
ncbi:unnamed protein product, partial [marine sediment metagenome]